MLADCSTAIDVMELFHIWNNLECFFYVYVFFFVCFVIKISVVLHYTHTHTHFHTHSHMHAHAHPRAYTFMPTCSDTHTDTQIYRQP